MNFTENFDQFSSKLSTMDLALYAGMGLVLWVLFKDKLSPVQKFLLDLFDRSKKTEVPTTQPTVQLDKIFFPKNPTTKPLDLSNTDETRDNKEDLFFKLVISWHQTRELALQSGCSKAVEVADQMFPFLSPEVCSKKSNKESNL